MKTIYDSYRDFVIQVLRSSLGAVGQYTAPARVQKLDTKPKQAILTLRKKIKSRLGGEQVYKASPMGETGVWVPDKQWSPSHIYVFDKRAKNQKTSLNIFSSPEPLYKWWLANSHYNPRKGLRRPNMTAYAFVSKQSVLNGLIRMIQMRAGNYMSGWNAFAQEVGSKTVKSWLPSRGNYGYDGEAYWVGSRGLSDFVARNAEAPDKSQAKYTEEVTQKYLPKQIEYHASKTIPHFVKAVQRDFDLKASQAREIVLNLIK